MTHLSQALGNLFIDKYRASQATNGTFYTAKQMRKRGIPLPLALKVLTRKESVRGKNQNM